MVAINIRTLTAAADCHACVGMQQTVWQMPDIEVIPVPVLMMAVSSGGLLQGAFAGDELAGFALAFAGYADSTPYLYSHALGVHPAYRRRQVGIRLKWAQAAAALAGGYRRITWTFDPLLAPNARLNLCRLGAAGRLYRTDLYGALGDGLNRGLPSDRLQVDWHLSDPRVQAVLQHLAAAPGADGNIPDVAERPPAAHAVNLDDGPDGRPPDQPELIKRLEAVPAYGWAYCRLPGNAHGLKERDPAAALGLRLRLRYLLGTALQLGWVVKYFAPDDQGGLYWLQKAAGGH